MLSYHRMPGLVVFLDLSPVSHYRQESRPYTIWLAQWVERLAGMPKTLGSILPRYINPVCFWNPSGGRQWQEEPRGHS